MSKNIPPFLLFRRYMLHKQRSRETGKHRQLGTNLVLFLTLPILCFPSLSRKVSKKHPCVQLESFLEKDPKPTSHLRRNPFPTVKPPTERVSRKTSKKFVFFFSFSLCASFQKYFFFQLLIWDRVINHRVNSNLANGNSGERNFWWFQYI